MAPLLHYQEDMKTTTLRSNGITITVFQDSKNPAFWYADQSNVEELEWLGGEKSAREFVARRVNQGWVRG